jgi:hypothetical protein
MRRDGCATASDPRVLLSNSCGQATYLEITQKLPLAGVQPSSQSARKTRTSTRHLTPAVGQTPTFMSHQLAFISALVAALCIGLLAALGGIATPGYSHLAQFISELGATQTATEYPVRFAGFLPAGVALLAFCWFAFRALPRARVSTGALLGLAVHALGYVVAAVFPCDPGCRPPQPSLSQSIHDLIGGLGYLVAPGFLFAFAIRSRTWPASAALPVVGFVAAVFALLGVLTLSPASPFLGLSQRAIEASVLGWVVACGWYLRSRLGVAVRS